MDVSAAFVADTQAFERVQPGEAAFYDPAKLAQPGAVAAAAAGDDRGDAPAA